MRLIIVRDREKGGGGGGGGRGSEVWGEGDYIPLVLLYTSTLSPPE